MTSVWARRPTNTRSSAPPNQRSSPSRRVSVRAASAGSGVTIPASEIPARSEPVRGRRRPDARRPRVGDQLDDVLRGIVEVARTRVPEVELELGAAVRRREQPLAAGEPRVRGREAVARHEQREVVERPPSGAGRLEDELGAADADRERAARPRARQPEPFAVAVRERAQDVARAAELEAGDPELVRIGSRRRAPGLRPRGGAACARRSRSPAGSPRARSAHAAGSRRSTRSRASGGCGG